VVKNPPHSNFFYDAIDIIEEKKQNDEKTALQVWKDGLSNVMPHVEVRSRRVGGANFHPNAGASRSQDYSWNEVDDYFRERP